MGEKLISKNHLTPAEIEFAYDIGIKKFIKIRNKEFFLLSLIDP